MKSLSKYFGLSKISLRKDKSMSIYSRKINSKSRLKLIGSYIS